MLKSDIDIALVHHRLPERIRAHALVLYRVMRERLRASDQSLSPRRALTLLRQIQKHKVEIHQKIVTGTGRLNPEQRGLFKALQLKESTEQSAL